MSLFKWIFGSSEDVQKKRAVSSNESLRGVLNDFLEYVELFKEKKRATESLDDMWFKGKINNLIFSVSRIKDIVKSEIQSERVERYLIDYILKNKSLKSEMPDIMQLEDLLKKLQENLQRQIEFFTYFSKHQDMNKLELEFKPLIKEEEQLLFSEQSLIEQLIRIQVKLKSRQEAAKKLRDSRKTESEGGYPWLSYSSTIDQIEQQLHMDFKSLIDNLSVLGTPVRILDVGCDVGICLKQLYEIFNGAVDLYGVGVKRKKEWELSLRDNIPLILRKRGGVPFGYKDIESYLKLTQNRPRHPNLIKFMIAHVEQLSKKFERGYFNLIYSHKGGITYATDIHAAIKECHILLKKGGIFVFNLSEPQYAKLTTNDFLGFEILKHEQPVFLTLRTLHLRKI